MSGISNQHYNKGEWAEFYVLLELLGKGKLYAADENLVQKPECYLEIIKVIREEIAGQICQYCPEADGLVEVYESGVLVAKVQQADFLKNAKDFFLYLKEAHGASVPAPGQICSFASKIHVNKPKSPSVRGAGNFGGKTDITIKLRDGRNSMVSTMGFSIKSQFGQPPTLYNAGTSSQLLFRMDGMTKGMADEFNSLKDSKGHRAWSDCVDLIANNHLNPVYLGTRGTVLKHNLLMLSSDMDRILAWLFRESLLMDRSCKELSSLCERMEAKDPLGYGIPELYEKRIKDFLFASFSGMSASVSWDGREQANGGYIVVKPDGEVLCYHTNDGDSFREYLFSGTHVEYVSSKKYQWSTVSQDAKGDYILPVNGSIRFRKTA